MNDEDLNSAVRRAFERQALSAPAPDGMLETVLAGSRRRSLRNGAAGVSAAAVAMAGVLVAADALPFAESTNPSGSAASTGGPGAFAADEIQLCVAYDGNRLTELTLAWVRPGRSQTEVKQNGGGHPPSLEYVARDETYAVSLDVIQADARPVKLLDSRSVTIDGRHGVIGSDPATRDRELYFATGVRDSLVQIAVHQADVGVDIGDDQLIAWAERISVSADPEECA